MFSFFRLPADRYDAIAPAMADLIQDPVANGDMLKQYKVDTESMAKGQEQSAKEAPAQTLSEATGNSRSQEKEPSTAVTLAPVDVNKIDWASIERQWGIRRDDLEKSGALNQMLFNHKSPQLFTVTPQMPVSPSGRIRTEHSVLCLTSSRTSLDSMCRSRDTSSQKRTRSSFSKPGISVK